MSGPIWWWRSRSRRRDCGAGLVAERDRQSSQLGPHRTGLMSSDTDDARIFPVDNRFNQLARRPGGLPRDQALERAHSTIDENKVGFGDWLEQELRQLNDAIERCASSDGRDAEAVDVAYHHCRHIRD